MFPSEFEITPLPFPDAVIDAYLTAYASSKTFRAPSIVDRTRESQAETDWFQSCTVECDLRTTFCENCQETEQLAKVKGCIRCLRCGWKQDCSGI